MPKQWPAFPQTVSVEVMLSNALTAYSAVDKNKVLIYNITLVSLIKIIELLIGSEAQSADVLQIRKNETKTGLMLDVLQSQFNS